MVEFVLFVVAGFVAGIITSIAGGAQFITFPLLNVAGDLPTRTANGTSSMTVWPSPLLTSFLLRDSLKLKKLTLTFLIIASFAGTIAGVLFVKSLSEAQFLNIVPFLLLFAAVSLTWGDRLKTRLRGKKAFDPNSLLLIIIQTAIGFYAGIYGGGMSLMMLAIYNFFAFPSKNGPQVLKNLLAGLMSFASAVAFAISGLVVWSLAFPLMIGNFAGGRVGTTLLKDSNPKYIKAFIIIFAWSITFYYFVR